MHTYCCAHAKFSLLLHFISLSLSCRMRKPVCVYCMCFCCFALIVYSVVRSVRIRFRPKCILCLLESSWLSLKKKHTPNWVNDPALFTVIWMSKTRKMHESRDCLYCTYAQTHTPTHKRAYFSIKIDETENERKKEKGRQRRRTMEKEN